MRFSSALWSAFARPTDNRRIRITVIFFYLEILWAIQGRHRSFYNHVILLSRLFHLGFLLLWTPRPRRAHLLRFFELLLQRFNPTRLPVTLLRLLSFLQELAM